ncbi:flagellar basal-body rod modification protein FlgD [Klenkia soli]|uniref:Flagellar basal-body rod modification protein FlgD n=1 Tax=Klenkia soli TaxID=1052260 RepID=A0A1H0CMC0_9ACTN|nr:flagellar hook capping FlgD N-terminal domain-containing protein [Klenkia soli]SDN59018.1 flagellar basal-body rod modification protein FlgD [Klenkia soli]
MTLKVSADASILAAAQSSATTTAGTTGMDKDTFLKLLVAQMKYQDPQSPTDSSAFITQTAAYSQVEALQALSDQNASMLAMQRATTAGALVGKSVSYLATDGTTVKGTVSSVTIATDSTEAQATVGGTSIPVSRLTAISA